MREVLGFLFLTLTSLTSCVQQGGHNHTYIISESVEKEASILEEEAR